MRTNWDSAKPKTPSDVRAAIQEARWLAVLVALAVYEAFYLVGGFFESTAFNAVGVLAFLVLLFVGIPGAPPDERSKTLWLASAPLLALVVAAVVHPENTAFYHLSKFILFYALVLLFSTILDYPVDRSRSFDLWRFLVLCPIAASLLFGRSEDVLGDVRTAGLFVNANTFALMAFLVPAVLPPQATPRQRLLVDALALGVIIASGTSGAMLAYFCAAVLTRLGARSLALLFGAAGVVALLGLVWLDELIELLRGYEATERLALQLQAISDGFSAVTTGMVDFAQMSREYGSSALSGIWRLVQWLTVWDRFQDGGVTVWAFGFGPGSAHVDFDKLPHNDYLRVLYEQGALGLGAFLFFFIRVLRDIAPRLRQVVLGFLLYCITENNLDNFLFMSLFAVIIATNTSSRSTPDPLQHGGAR